MPSISGIVHTVCAIQHRWTLVGSTIRTIKRSHLAIVWSQQDVGVDTYRTKYVQYVSVPDVIKYYVL